MSTAATTTTTTAPEPPLALTKSSSAASSSSIVNGRRSTSSAVLSSGPLGDKVTLISGGVGLNFVICDCPTDRNLDSYISEFAKHKVRHVVRLCESPYTAERLEYVGIKVTDLPFKDGEAPPAEVVKRWLAITDECLALPEEERPAIAVHCVAGLGRAPILVAIALTEYGMEPLDAVEFIRKKRAGAFNSRQITYVDGYKRRKNTMSSLRKGISKLFVRS